MTSKQEKLWRMALIPLGILLSFLIPLPQLLLDTGLCINFILSLTVVFWVFSLKSSLEARLFPALFVYLCLFRLGLNLASTRLILSSGWASPMIFSLGNFFSLGSLGAGIAACCLFFLVNFLVIAKGSERVAEVRARFILEALPGKQMSLDADLVSGRASAMDVEKQKQDLFEESDFFSSMEGVFRFVKGDAVVSCILLIVNTIAAAYFACSVDRESASLWLTVVGDALVSQVPALMTSCAAATLISKVGQKASLLEYMIDYYEQARVHFRTIALLFSSLLFIPGTPKAPVIVFAIALLIAYKPPKDVQGPEILSEIFQQIHLSLPTDYTGVNPHELYAQAREEIFNETGVFLHQEMKIFYRDKPASLSCCGKHFHLEEISLSRLLPILRNLLPEAIHGNYVKMLVRQAQNVLGISIDEIIPKKISENSLLFLIKGLVKERVSLRLFPKVLEAIALYGSPEENPEILAEKIRKYLGKHIGRALWDQQNTLEIITVDSHVERMIGDLYSKSNPLMCDKVICQVQTLLNQSAGGDFRAIITGCESRFELRKMIEPYFPDLLVLSHNELPEEIPISLLGSVSDEVLTL
ncbi:type III secretion system protein [Chlamydia abortus]|nr:FHIPEP family type III secretion protein [Chlamydia abortus]SFZ99926.1 type III secretion system protein [Chlamydia abortus]SGA00823.1 type III secretion system protein [Chlamydia abortus]SGA01673.1 type III secretion system protein [Chlamydia abortus]SGA07469.1 type III secretion system protein [Chlamydia abortus]